MQLTGCNKFSMVPCLAHRSWRAVLRQHQLMSRTCSSFSRGSPSAANAVVLGIESSCDDTGVAIVTDAGRVLGESLVGQADVHAPWGGVVPKLAQEAHEAAINSCVDEALAQAGLTPDHLDAVAVTVGPGLSLCLRVGVQKARQLAAAHRLPLVSVHHMEAHALVSRLGTPQQQAQGAAQPGGYVAVQIQQQQQQQNGQNGQNGQQDDCGHTTAVQGSRVPAAEQQNMAAQMQQDQQQEQQEGQQQQQQEQQQPGGTGVQFPFLCLLISGGHNLLLVVEGVGQYVQLGTTLDDALGEAYDKVARLLGLDLKPSGGAALESFARDGDAHAVPLSVPMQRRPNCDFSFAGLKTAVRLAIEARVGEEGPTEANRQLRADIAASFQRVGVQHLEERVRRALTWARESHPGIQQLVVAGGVASNQYIRGRLAEVAAKGGVELVCPPPRLCTDNGVMVAWAGLERLRLGLAEDPPPLESAAESESDKAWLELRPRWPLTDRKDPRSYEAPRSAKKKNIFASLESALVQQEGLGAQQAVADVSALRLGVVEAKR